ncbi:MAG: extracellular solute-binding protein, partial [Candidatus Methylomirabilis sp.]|nr:extracellular solute-binding protein [Deltaproteobacteria bacterium]
VQLTPDDGSVVAAILAGKASVGATTLEQALAAKKAGKTIDFLYPTDGVIMIPEMLAIPSNVHKPDVAKAVYDFILSKTGQDVIVSGFAHSPQPEIAEPEGAKPWHDLVGVAMTWTHPFVADVSNHRAQIDETFRSIMAN